MENGKAKDTATYLVQKFLSSELSYTLEINAFDIAILYTLARYLDMPQNKCCPKQTTFARNCHMSVREFKRRSERLFKLKIIMRYLKKKLYHYELGEMITGITEEIEGAYWAPMSEKRQH